MRSKALKMAMYACEKVCRSTRATRTLSRRPRPSSWMANAPNVTVKITTAPTRSSLSQWRLQKRARRRPGSAASSRMVRRCRPRSGTNCRRLATARAYPYWPSAKAPNRRATIRAIKKVARRDSASPPKTATPFRSVLREAACTQLFMVASGSYVQGFLIRHQAKSFLLHLAEAFNGQAGGAQQDQPQRGGEDCIEQNPRPHRSFGEESRRDLLQVLRLGRDRHR